MTSQAHTVVLAALRAETSPLRPALEELDVSVATTGMGPRRAAAAAREHAAGAGLLVVTGTCGGLVAGASPGMLVIPERVLKLESSRVASAPAPEAGLVQLARQSAEGLGLHCSCRPLVTVRRPLLTPEDKRECHLLSGAVAVDMETAAIAEVAAELDVPYLCVRVVLDAANESLPQVPMVSGEGRVQPSGLLKAAGRPASLLTMARLTVRLKTVSPGLARCLAVTLKALEEG